MEVVNESKIVWKTLSSLFLPTAQYDTWGKRYWDYLILYAPPLQHLHWFAIFYESTVPNILWAIWRSELYFLSLYLQDTAYN